MSKPKGLLSKNFSAFLWVAFLAAVVYLVVRNIGVFGNVLLIVVGFGAVVLVHEFGHFIVAKLSGIKVEVFSIFMPPTLVGVRRTEEGLRFRILPRFFPKENDESGDGRLSFTIGRKGKAGPVRSKTALPEGTSNGAGETEYRVGLIPFGGFNKLLGQEDTGPTKAGDDPRSYANKPVGVRMAVISAGVFFNAVSAIVIFMVVFLIGINLPPAVVGGVVPNSPAARAGLKAGDEVIEIAGWRGNLDFSNIDIAAALSDVNEAVRLKVRHEDDSTENFAIVAKQLPGVQMKRFGVVPPQSLTIGNVSDANALLAKTGLLPGDRIKSVNGRDVETYWELKRIVQNALVPEVSVLAERAEGTEEGELVESEIGLDLMFADSYEIKSEGELYHIYSMVPRIRVKNVVTRPPTLKDRVVSLLNKMGIVKSVVVTRPGLQKGDIIVGVGDVENPTYKEMREVVVGFEDRELPVKVLRIDANGVERAVAVTVVPRRLQDVDWVEIGIGVVLDAEHPIVAKTIADGGGLAALAIPRGAVITAVDGSGVSNFYDIIREIRRNAGQRITIDYRLDEEVAGDVALDVGTGREFVTVKSAFAEFVPFEVLKRPYKASGPIDAVVMGCKKTVMFIAQTYLTLKGLVGGLVSPKNLIGPVGILAVSYRIVVEQPLVYYFYLLGLISACIAVINFLPLPPLDGGLIVLLVVEKVKGSALSEWAQGMIAYVGWAFIGALILYVTFNDIVRIVKSFFIFG